MEDQPLTAVVILDLSAAFNTVDHDLLLEVVEKWFGITGSARLWYQNYLKPRKFKVAIGQKKSETRQLDFSVPQGSIQGTFLFITYASTIEDIVDQLTLNGCADDHSAGKTFRSSRLDHKEKLDTIIIEEPLQDVKTWMYQV